MIKALNLTKSFGDIPAVAGVSLQVQAGDIFGLVGPDGAGKTTLIRMMCGIVEPENGEVVVLGRPAGALEKAGETMGYMPQRFSLYGDLTIMENINFFGSMYKLSKKVICERAGEILEVTGLTRFKDRLADNLSGGMKQKLALTCSLVARPKLLLLDEPTYGVDPESRKEFWKILYLLNGGGMTILVSTPYMDEAELCRSVAFMDSGMLTAVGSPQGLKEEFSYQVLEVRAGVKDPDIFNGLEEVLDVSYYGDKYHVTVNGISTALPFIKARLSENSAGNASIREIPPSMEDVFISLSEKEVV